MFALTTINHIVEIFPNVLGRDFLSTLIEKINKQFANYVLGVIPNVGLCITFYDFKKIGDSYILPGNASTHTPIVFRYIVFQPIVNEIIEGIISHDEKVQIWYWEYQSEDNITKFYMDPGRRVSYVVSSVSYHNIEPGTSNDSTSAMKIEASMIDMGLGCVDWWDPSNSDEVKQEMNEND
ncbi:RNA_pol_Rbc25 domain-containing protein [Meloidogyne graminicola]|uniref:RNA_pol_Rbc25 domain-containing protein n=1 Tax=Meloidogyne graminicola TaxID=189291 RepID=A0A8S9ZXJ6_9BILA|nr:RNA_pol_Rbc25 domain-containing protein [Meloidogyne graminicola]